ncbi:MAG TPA: 3-hydroxyacyl-ACP dehydratase FabZ [Stellaceae bacterium]|nr:3-hydroxyacyl-ACP dehydratase FabZ [Stellaceae bacterium]
MDAEVPGTVPDLDIVQIMDLIPHRYPFLLIDRLEEIVPEESAVGIKNVTMNEPFFQGHFPGRPIMPGVLIIEAMAQTAACLVVHSLAGTKGAPKLVYFMSIDEARFRKPVTPGDQLRIQVKKERNRANVWRFKGEARVDGQLLAEAVYTAMIVND